MPHSPALPHLVEAASPASSWSCCQLCWPPAAQALALTLLPCGRRAGLVTHLLCQVSLCLLRSLALLVGRHHPPRFPWSSSWLAEPGAQSGVSTHVAGNPQQSPSLSEMHWNKCIQIDVLCQTSDLPTQNLVLRRGVCINIPQASAVFHCGYFS